MTSWPFFCGVVCLLAVSIHSTTQLNTADQQVAAENPDTNVVLRGAVQYIADEAARLPEDPNENFREILSLDAEPRGGAGGGKRGLFPSLHLSDDTVEESGNIESPTDLSRVKRRWGDATLQLWGKRDSEVMAEEDRSGNDSVQDSQGLRQHRPGSEGGQRLEMDDLDLEVLPESLHNPFHTTDSTGDTPCPFDGTHQRSDFKSTETSKRKWGDNSMTLWGKRMAYEKRKWGDNTLSYLEKSEDESLKQPMKRKWGDNSMTAWGKRSSDEKRKWGDNSMTLWGKRSSDDKRKWGDNSMTLWGKRSSDDKRKWKDNSLTAWGKRRQTDDKRKWGDNSMSIWGKRLSDYKRKWGDNSMTIWGKRQANDNGEWGDNSLSSWGKEQIDDKRKWGDNSLMAWGKRQSDDKRKWGDNIMSIWGKRQADDKRKWGDNSMTAWGKRQANDKRKWGDNSMTAWGKRQTDVKRNWGDGSMSSMSSGAREDGQYQPSKRKWGDNSMTVWGKKRTNSADGPSRVTLNSWLRELSNDNTQPFRPGHEESQGGKSRVALPGGIHSAGDSFADATKDTSVAASTIERLNSQVPNDHPRPPAIGKGSSNRKSVAKRSISETPYMPSTWPKRLRKRGWGFWGAYVNPYGGPKRNWETNTMKVWGKRRDEIKNDDEADQYTSDWATTSAERDDRIWKRIWTSDNSIRIWGR